MLISVVPNQDALMSDLRAFVLAVLPPGVEVVQGQGNRVPEPKSSDHVVLTPIRRPRMRTNVTRDSDCTFVGAISGTALVVSAMLLGAIRIGASIWAPGVAAGTVISSQSSGTSGEIGTYVVSISQTVAAVAMAAGAREVEQGTEIVVQMDVRGPSSADNGQVLSTLLRDPFANEFFAGMLSGISPMYASDPMQMPFSNDQQQVEDRWMIEAHLYSSDVVVVPQQYADQAAVTVISVAAEYPPT